MRSTKNSFARFMLILSISIGLATSAAPPAWSHSGFVLREFGTAVVDGIISPDEYGGSCIVPRFNFPMGDRTYQIMICETNDGINDYYAFKVNDLTEDPSDGIELYFDDEHDGAVATSSSPGCAPGGSSAEDSFGTSGGAGSFDGFYCNGPSPPSGYDQNSLDVVRAAQFTPGEGWVFELSHPLNTGDPDDYSLSVVDTVGWCIRYTDDSNLVPLLERLYFPPDCFPHAVVTGSTAKYGDIKKINALLEWLPSLQDLIRDVETTRLSSGPSLAARLEMVQELLTKANGFLIRANKANLPKSRSDLAVLRGAIGHLKTFIAQADSRSKEIDQLNGPGTAQDLSARAEVLVENIQTLIERKAE